MFTFATNYSERMAHVNPPQTRRERIFGETQDELAAAARALLVDGGPEAVTIRAVAGRAGMTGPAIYRYFPSRESLLERVIRDLYEELAEHLVRARESKRRGSVRDRMLATSRAFRQWAFDHKAEFGLLFGAPIPGVTVEKDEHDETGRAFGQLWLEMFAEIHASGRKLTWPHPVPKKLAKQVEGFVAEVGVDIPADAALLYLYCWQSLYGAVCTEVFGHLAWAITDGEDFFEGRLLELAALLHLDE